MRPIRLNRKSLSIKKILGAAFVLMVLLQMMGGVLFAGGEAEYDAADLNDAMYGHEADLDYIESAPEIETPSDPVDEESNTEGGNSSETPDLPDEAEDSEYDGEDSEEEEPFVPGDLLSITRPQFNNMTPEEIAEMAEAGGYMPVGIVENIALTRRSTSNTCPNVDNGDFITNVIVDGAICIGNPLDELGPQGRTIAEPTGPAAFVSAWGSEEVTQINLTSNIRLAGSAVTGAPAVGALTGTPRPRGVVLDGGGHMLTLQSTGTTNANAVHPRLVLGNLGENSGVLELNNIRLGRIATNTTGAGTGLQGGTNAPAEAENLSIFTVAAVANSSNWEVNIRDNVTTDVTNAIGSTLTNANATNRSGIFNLPDSHVTVTGRGNNFNINTAGSNAVNMMNIGSLTMQGAVTSENASQLTFTMNGNAAVAVNTTVAGSVAGDVTLEPNANLTVNRPTTTAGNTGNLITTRDFIANTHASLTMDRNGGAGAGLSATGDIELGENATINVPRFNGGGHVINSAGTITADDGSIVNITRTGAGGGLIATGAVDFGDGASIGVTMTSAGAGHAISGATLTMGENADFEINRTGGAGNGINVTNNVTFGEHANIEIIMSSNAGTVHTIQAPEGVEFGADSEVNITRTSALPDLTDAAATTARNATVINTNNLIVNEGTEVIITITGLTQGIIATNQITAEIGSKIDITRTTTAFGGTGATAGPTAARAAARNTAGINTNNLIIDQSAEVSVTTAGHGHGLNIQNLEVRDEANLNVISRNPVGNTNSLHGPSAAVRVRSTGTITVNDVPGATTESNPTGTVTGVANSRIDIGENAEVIILNEGARIAADSDAGDVTQSHGLFGSIGIFDMAANSYMNIDSQGVGFRSTSSTIYTMREGSTKYINARGTTTGRPAFVLANSYTTGSANAQGNHATRTGISHHIRLEGEGTVLNLTGRASVATNSSANRANLKVFGDHSTFHVLDGAKLNNLSHNTTAMLFFGVGTDFTVNENSSMNIEVRGSADANAGAFRFLQSGSQTFNLVGGEVTVLATAGNAALLRAFGGNNAFYISEGGLLELIHSSTSAGADGIDFAYANHGAVAHSFDTADRFSVEGYRSEVYIRTNRIGVSGSDASDSGVTGAAGSNSNITRVDVNEGAIFVVSGAAPGEIGIFNAGRLHLTMDNPLFFDFVNRAPGDALIFNTFSTTSNPSTMTGTNTDLALWRNTRVNGTANTGATEDPISGDAGGFWGNMDFVARPAHNNTDSTTANNVNLWNNNFANATLEANGGSTTEPRFSHWFNDDGLTQHTGSQAAPTAGQLPNHVRQNGWRQIRRMSANNAPPIVDILRTPTDADQRIFGHVTIPEGNRSARSAFDNEVFVDLVILDPAGNVVQEVFNAPTGTYSVYGGPEHAGVFVAEVDFGPGSGFAPGTTFLPIDYTVEVITARRSADGLDGLPGGDGRENYRETCLPSHVASIDYPLCQVEGNLTGVERVRDITPPEQVEDVEAFVDGLAPGREGTLDGPVLTNSTRIIGTGEPGAFVRVARVTPSTGNGVVTAVNEWLGDPVEVNEEGEWEFSIPPGTNLVAGERLSIYITDDEGLDDLSINSLDPNRELPEVIYRRGTIFVPEEGGDGEWVLDPTLNSRMDVLYFNLPRTALTVPWANAGPAPIGNMGYHWSNRTEFHDAAVVRGNQGFDYAYILTVEAAVEIDFMWNYSDSDDYFYQDVILPGQTVNRPSPDPERELYHFLCWSTTHNGGCGPDSDEFDFDTPLTEDTTLYAQWLGQQAFSFIKTDQYLYEDFDALTRLPDAEFKLERETYVPGECLEYDEDVCTSREEGTFEWVYVMTATSQGAPTLGQVDLLLVPGFRYRLTEVEPPFGFRTPDGHWSIEMDMDGELTIAPQITTNTDEWEDDDLPPFYYRDGTWFVGNLPGADQLSFIKTEDDGLTPLPDAVFHLYERNDAGDGWNPVPIEVQVSQLLTGLVSFETLLFDGEYRLREELAPSGFATPPSSSYWLIVVENGAITSITRSGHAPEFEDGSALENNPNDLDLLRNERATAPITGLGDSNLLLGALLLTAGLLVVVFSYRRLKRMDVI